MNREDRPPHIDPAVVAYLQRLFPDRSPTLTMAEKEVWYAAGSAAVTRHLLHLLKQQQENILEN